MTALEVVQLVLAIWWAILAGFALFLLVAWYRDPYRERGGKLRGWLLRRRIQRDAGSR